MATLNSGPQHTVRSGGGNSLPLVAGTMWLALLVLGTALAGGPKTPTHAVLAARAHRLYLAAKRRHRAATTNITAAWHFARACFDWADFATNDDQRAAIAQEGITVGRQWLKRTPTSAPTVYYLAMNLGQLARTETLGALSLVRQMEKLFIRARALNPKFDHAGPDRGLGLLYRDAPGWPASIGSRSKALSHLRQAVVLAPNYPENRLNLLEALLRWGEKSAIRKQVQATAALWPKAHARLTGIAWASSWQDWEKRWHAILSQTGPPIEVGGPRE